MLCKLAVPNSYDKFTLRDHQWSHRLYYFLFHQKKISKVSTSILVIHLFEHNVGNICGSSFQVPTVLDLVGACVCDDWSITPIEILSWWTKSWATIWNIWSANLMCDDFLGDYWTCAATWCCLFDALWLANWEAARLRWFKVWFTAHDDFVAFTGCCLLELLDVLWFQKWLDDGKFEWCWLIESLTQNEKFSLFWIIQSWLRLKKVLIKCWIIINNILIWVVN